MIYLRDNNGVFEASSDGQTWEAVVLGTGGGGVTDHTLLTNIGTNTHAQIDTHIANTGIHGGGGWNGTLTPVIAALSETLTVDDLDTSLLVNDATESPTTITLPVFATVAEGQVFRAACRGQTLTIQPQSLDAYLSHDGQTIGESIYSSTPGAYLEIMKIGSLWQVIRAVGTWTLYFYQEN